MKSKGYLPAALVGLFTLVIFLPAVKNGFVDWDDYIYVADNPHIIGMDSGFLGWAFSDFAYVPFWMPLTWISFAIDHFIWGQGPYGYHLTNVLLHSVNALLVSLLAFQMIKIYYLGKETGKNDPQKLSDGMMETFALLTGILFGIHPLRVESVAWISERKDVLSGMFGLVAVLLYVSYAKKRAETPGKLVGVLADKRYISALFFFAMSLMSKPMTVTLPIIFLIADWFPLQRFSGFKKSGRFIMEKTPFFLASLFAGIITVIAHRPYLLRSAEVPAWPRMLVAGKSTIAYLLMMIRPSGLMALYDHPGKTASLLKMEFFTPVVLIIIMTMACLIFVRRSKIWLAVWACYLTTLLPIAGLAQAGEHAMADRFTYLPSIAPAMLAASGIITVYRMLDRVKILRYGLIAAVSVVLVYFSVITSRLIPVWHDTESLWTHAITEHPLSASGAYYNRGSYYFGRGIYDKALRDMDSAIKINLKNNNLKPGELYFARAGIYMRMEKYNEAIDDLTEAMRLNPHKPEGKYYSHRGLAFQALGMRAAAEKDFETAGQISRESDDNKEQQ